MQTDRYKLALDIFNYLTKFYIDEDMADNIRYYQILFLLIRILGYSPQVQLVPYMVFFGIAAITQPFQVKF